MFTVQGHITDDVYGLPVSNYYVYFFFNEKGFSATAVTDKNGFYTTTFEIEEGTTEQIIVGTHGTCGDEIWDLIFDNTESYPGTSDINFNICYSQAPTGCKAEFEYVSDGDIGANFISTTKDSIKVHLWAFGDGTYNFSDAPYHKYTEVGSYEVCLTIKRDDNCEDTKCKNITVRKLYKIIGRVIAGDTTINRGNVLLFKKNKETFAPNTHTGITFKGDYAFNELEAGEYLVYAIPKINLDVRYFPKYIPSYFGGAYRWQDAIIKKDESNETIVDVELVSYDIPFYGHCRINGILKTDSTYTSDREIPVLLLNSKKEAMDFRIPDPVTGEYQFPELPYGVYFLHPEKAGIVSEQIKIVLSENRCKVESPSFMVNSDTISVGIKNIETNIKFNTIKISPNPAKDFIYFNVEDKKNKIIEIFDISGKKVLSVNNISKENIRINISSLKKAIYIVQLKTKKGFIIGKFIKQ